MPPLRNILIFHLGALGDFLLTWPLAMALTRIHPQSRVFYITHAQKGQLAERLLRVESADIEAGWHHLFADPAHLPDPAARLLAGAHSIYTFIAEPHDPWSSNVTAANPTADLCCLNPTPPADSAQHATDHHLSQLASRPVVAEAIRQMLRSIADRGVMTSPPPSGTDILIHPGSGSPSKCWPIDHFLTLARLLLDQGRPVRFLIGEVEQDRWPPADLKRLENTAPLDVPRTPMDLLAVLTRNTALYLGHDTGPSHLAALCGIPTYTLFGPTDPAVWRPLGPRVHTLRHQPLDTLDPETVLRWLNE
jgi:ADP-heptose:LPS heptosyltransferase